MGKDFLSGPLVDRLHSINSVKSFWLFGLVFCWSIWSCRNAVLLCSAVRVFDLVWWIETSICQHPFGGLSLHRSIWMLGFGKGIPNSCFFPLFCLNANLGFFLKF